MGSRRRRNAALSEATSSGARAAALTLAALAAGACTSGAPPGFAGAGSGMWTMPLVGPLENGLLVTPVMVNTYGPYLVAIDPDAPISIFDYEVAKAASLRPFAGPPRLDETDTQRTSAYGELVGLEVGTLIIERREVLLVPSRTFDTAGRRIHGVLGRDIIADSLVLGFDRERGLAYLVTAKAFRPPTDPAAVALPYEDLVPRIANAIVQPAPRRLVPATIGGERFALHVDLGAVASQLREGLWERAKLEARDTQAAVVDEVGSRRVVTRRSEPAAVSAGGLTGTVAFIPYADRRWVEQDVAGSLGLGFFADHTVWASWDARTMYALPRAPRPAAERIARWDSPVLAKCPHLGCVQARLVDPLAGKPPAEGKAHPGVVLSIARDELAGGMPLEVVLAAEGEPALPHLIANLPPHVDRLIHQLKPEFLGRTLAVIDASPHPRACPGDNGCVDQLAR